LNHIGATAIACRNAPATAGTFSLSE